MNTDFYHETQLMALSPKRQANVKQYTIHGDAMAPAFPAGCFVLAREHNPEHFVEWGEAYMLETEEGPMLARLIPGKDADHYKLRRDNPRYYDMDIPKNAVLSVYRVFACAQFM